jgi:glycosyltransferase involved in cell wall biosynthesis
VSVHAGFDVSPLEQTRAGTARYISGLLPRLEGLPGLEMRRLHFPGAGRAAAVARDTAWYLGALPLAARRAGLDVLHCPTFRAPVRSPVPVVVTVHDLAVLRHPETFPLWARTYGRALVPRVVRAAARVIAVSRFTKEEVVRLLGVAENDVHVVPNGVDDAFAPEGPAEPGDYVVAVGTLEPRKNLRRLAEATQALGVELRVVGATGWGRVRLNGNGVRWLGEVPDERLPALYRGALCAAYPSLYEGFGLPVLEAMACGTPVVTSAGGGTEEIAGGAAVLVDPRDSRAIAAGIEEAISRRAELSRRGPERARRYSWDAAAEGTAAVYRKAAG